MKRFVPLIVSLLVAQCTRTKQQVDVLVHHAMIYTVDSAFSTAEAFAVKDGKFVEVGGNDIADRYDANEVVDAQGATVLPGLIDAHCHFLAYGLGLRNIDLTGTRSFGEVLSRVVKAAGNRTADSPPSTTLAGDTSWLIGRGWDQNDWTGAELPTRRRVDSLFPARPVYLTRIDGHAALVNGKALRLAGITASTKVAGGEVVVENGVPTGVLVDNAMDLVKKKLPGASDAEKCAALLRAQKVCLAYGLTTVDDAGGMYRDFDLADSLHASGKLKIRIYGMLTDSAPNYERYIPRGPYKTARLNVRSFKLYGDGALGSRGACLKKDYADRPGWRGFLLKPLAHYESRARLLDSAGFQVNTHCIGDSAVAAIMTIYERHCNRSNGKRWRIEHAQVVDNEERKGFSGDIIPSVQPTHATSDMYWAGQRLGVGRLCTAYAYRELLNAAGVIALGTDFPVEHVSPFRTFYAAVARKDSAGFPPLGFCPANALTRQQTLRGMTTWAAYANFEEKEKGSIEAGKVADFILIDTDIMRCAISHVLKAEVQSTWISGERVYSREIKASSEAAQGR